MDIFLKLGWYFRSQWRRYLVAVLLLTVVAGLTMVPPWITGRIVDAVAAGTLTKEQLLQEVSVILVVAVATYVFRFFWRISLFGASFHLGATLRQKIHRHLIHLSSEFFQRHRTGDLMARATNDITAVEMTAGEGVLSLFDGALTGIVILSILIFALSWELTLVTLLPWPIMTYLMWRYGKTLHSQFGEAQARFSQLNDQVQESVSGIRTLKSYGQEPLALKNFDGAANRATISNLNVALTEAKYEPTIYLSIAASFLLAVAAGAWLIVRGEFSIGQLTSFTMYLGYLIWPMFAFGWLLNLVERGSAAYARVSELLSERSDIEDVGTLDQVGEPAFRIALPEYCYPNSEQPALRDLHLAIPSGTTLGIVGPTGAGKTTLIRALTRAVNIPANSIVLGGEPVEAYRLSALRGCMALVPQDPFLFSTSIFENIALGAPDATREQVREVARLADIDDDIMAFPDQYDTEVGERGVTLSGGQKQRLAIARALLLDAPILLLDDALSAVDVNTEQRILEHLTAYRAQRTNIIVSHRLTAVEQAEQIIVLEEGQVKEQGDHEALMAEKGWYARTYQTQQMELAIGESL